MAESLAGRLRARSLARRLLSLRWVAKSLAGCLCARSLAG